MTWENYLIEALSFLKCLKRLSVPFGAFFAFRMSTECITSQARPKAWRSSLAEELKKSGPCRNGNFGSLWSKQTQRVGKKAQVLQNEDGTRVEINDIQLENDADFLAITANETSTGIAYTNEEISKIRKKFPQLLFGVDATSVMGAMKFDFEKADGWLFSVQKCFGMPAGLGIILVSPRLFEKAKQRESEGKDVGGHHSIPNLEKKMSGKFQTPTTPNVLNIATLGFVCEQFQMKYGSVENLTKRTIEKAEKIYSFFESHPKFSPDVASGRSQTTIVVDADEDVLELLHKKLSEKNIVIGKGYGPKKMSQIRIANFPASSIVDMDHLLGAISEAV